MPLLLREAVLITKRLVTANPGFHLIENKSRYGYAHIYRMSGLLIALEKPTSSSGCANSHLSEGAIGFTSDYPAVGVAERDAIHFSERPK